MPGLLNPKKAARELQGMGVRGDTILAHINPREVSLLKAHGGAGTKNPKTGLLQFESDSSDSGGEGPGGEGPSGASGPGTGADGSGNGTGGVGGDHGNSSGSMSGKGDNSPPGPNGETTDANEAMGVDMGLGAVGPGRGGTINGPSIAGIVGAIAAGLLGPGVATANSITGLNDPGGKTAASHAMEAMGISGTPMGSVSFGGNPMGAASPGSAPSGGAPGGGPTGGIGQGFDGGGAPYGAPNTPSAPSPQLAAFPSAAPSLLAPPPKPQNNVWPYMPFGTMPFTPKR